MDAAATLQLQPSLCLHRRPGVAQVYDGSRSLWREGDPLAPVNAYGRTKLAGEQAVAAGWPNHAVLRSSIIYGPPPPQPVSRPLFLQFIDAQLAEGVRPWVCRPARGLLILAAWALLAAAGPHPARGVQAEPLLLRAAHVAAGPTGRVVAQRCSRCVPLPCTVACAPHTPRCALHLSLACLLPTRVQRPTAFFDDEFRSPVCVEDIARVCQALTHRQRELEHR